MRVRFTRSARRHRLGKAHVLEVVNTHSPQSMVDERGERLIWIGSDSRGLELEVIGLVIADELLIIHAMPYQFRRKGTYGN